MPRIPQGAGGEEHGLAGRPLRAPASAGTEPHRAPHLRLLLESLRPAPAYIVSRNIGPLAWNRHVLAALYPVHRVGRWLRRLARDSGRTLLCSSCLLPARMLMATAAE